MNSDVLTPVTPVEPVAEHADANTALSGSLQIFSLREILDLLNHGKKHGALEVLCGDWQAEFHLHQGRIQAATASGVDGSWIVDSLPASLSSLAPILNLTLAGKSGPELDGVLQLLDANVVDVRLLRKLLRHQAAMLLLSAFTSNGHSFRFNPGAELPPLYQDLPLEISSVALVVEAASCCVEDLLPNEPEEAIYVRAPIRGQNLDRAGLLPRQQKLMGLMSQPVTVRQLAEQTDWELDEVRRTVFALSLTEFVETHSN